MKFSLFLHMERISAEDDERRLYEEMVELCRIADEGGLMGLSPRTRGNRYQSAGLAPPSGPIPAHAGQPASGKGRNCGLRAYPRARGATVKDDGTVNLAVGLYTPPVGTTLFITSALAKVKVGQTVRELGPFYFVAFLVLALVSYVPASILG